MHSSAYCKRATAYTSFSSLGLLCARAGLLIQCHHISAGSQDIYQYILFNSE